MVDSSYGAEVISSETIVLLFDQGRNAISSEVLHFHKINIGRCWSSWYLCRAADGGGDALPFTASLLFECNAVHYADGDGVALDVGRESLAAGDHHDAGEASAEAHSSSRVIARDDLP